MFFYALIIFTILILILFSTIKINIQNLKISTEKLEDKDIYNIVITIYVLNKIPILKISINNKKLEIINLKEKLKKADVKAIKDSKINYSTFKKVKKFMPQIKRIELKIDIGTEEAIFTSYLVVIISSAIGIIIKDTLMSNINHFIAMNLNPKPINSQMISAQNWEEG